MGTGTGVFTIGKRRMEKALS